MDTLTQDIRFALRTFRKNPGFTAVALLTLALGIGANTAIFSVVNAVLIRALPYEEPESLVVLWGNVRRAEVERRGASFPDFGDWRAQNRSFEDLAWYTGNTYTLAGRGDEPERVSGELVSPGYFELLRVRPLYGRGFEDRERAPGAPLTAVLGHGLWMRRFGGAPSIVGSTVTLSDRMFTIVGVMPPGFRGITDTADLWVSSATESNDVYTGRGDRQAPVLGRLKPGVALASAQADVSRIARDLERAYPATNQQRGVEVTSLTTDLFAGIREALLLVLGAVTVVLLIACANVASLLLARAEARQREMAIRTAIGAARSRIARQLVVEGLLLTLTAGAFGILVARWAADALIAFSPVTFPGFVSPSADRTVLLFTFGVSTIMGLLLGLAPMWQIGGGSLASTLKDAGRGTIGGGRLLFRQTIVTVEIALAVILLVGAGLLIRTMAALSAIDPGFHVERLLTLRVSLPALPTAPGAAAATTDAGAGTRASSSASSSASSASASASSTSVPSSSAALAILERLRSLPGVEHAGLGTSLPLGGDANATSYTVEGQPPLGAHERPRTYRQRVMPGFFETTGIKLIAGRDFTEAEMQEEGRQRAGVAPAAPTPIIVSERLVDRFWPGQDPIGKRMKYGAPDSTAPWMRIVGVVRETKMRRLPVNNTADPDVFQPFRPQVRGFAVLLRTAVPPETLVETARRAIRDVEPGATIFNVAPMEQRVAEQMARPRFVSWLMGAFAGLALLLAAIGVYGVLAQQVARRTQEIGIRMALGAGAGEILRMVLRRGLGLVGVGLAIGAAGALAMTRLIQTLLFGVSQTDPVTFAGVMLTLGMVALLATWIPARRAMRVDPLVALRRD
jgi:ABC-type antimicrobial peptide transport system permease subunit